MSDFQLKQIGTRILADLKLTLGKAYDSWTDDEKKLIESVADDAAWVTMQVAAGADIKSEQDQIKAQLLNIKSADASEVNAALWSVAHGILQAAALALLK